MVISENDLKRVSHVIHLKYLNSNYTDFIKFYKDYKETFISKVNNQQIICECCYKTISDRFYVNLEFNESYMLSKRNKVFKLHESCLDDLVKKDIIEGGICS